MQIVDDEVLVRASIRTMLNTVADMTVTATCPTDEAVATARSQRPDVVLLGLRTPATAGLTALRHLRRLDSPPQVAILTGIDNDRHIREALRLGATGFLLKDTEPDVLACSVRALATGAGCLSAPLIRLLSRQDPRDMTMAQRCGLDRLSARERQTLGLLGQGLTNAEIGEQMNISITTVKDYVKAVLTKLGVTNRVQAAVLAARTGVIQ